MTKFEHKYDNFKNAVKRLSEANIEYKKSTGNELYQDALIQRFEFTFELAWKTLMQFMIDQGYTLGLLSPKGVISTAYQYELINSESVWLNMLEDQNATAHDYGRELAAGIADKISNVYCKELLNLRKLFENK